MEQHLTPACQTGTHGYCSQCEAPVKQDRLGRWFITMGHPGFNSPANNRLGYGTQAQAVAAYRRYGRGI
jgi:hypothetical protein